ncbi:palmitoyltransferase [Plakobranchus ocellatus]|uniref:Palmitoyltransferase n=1 Tax=Plakobranchus ocellatus TaxID=259542 RepID=A0AAV4E0L4_9GAST|nr:palmitoyltransferase [Plakobranchus ocellatus]
MAVHLPQNGTDAALFALFWLGGIFTLVYECYFILWSYHTEWNNTVFCLYLSAFYLAAVIYSCMYKIISTDVSLQASNCDAQNLSDVGWKYCEVCQSYAPPRSHHCKICNECILKRDHHCWYAGYCIGYQNHRYFMCLVFHASVAGLFANIYNWDGGNDEDANDDDNDHDGGGDDDDDDSDDNADAEMMVVAMIMMLVRR